MNILVDSEIESRIYNIRDQKVMLDSDLAKLYQVETKNLNKAVSRNIKRFPSDFMFQLTDDELENLRFQNGTSSWGGTRYLPKVFTEHGILMLSSVLKSDIASEVNIQIMRTFTKMREFALNYKDIVIKLQSMEESIRLTQDQSSQNSKHIKTAFELLSEILEDTKNTDKNLIGFRPKSKKEL